MTRVVIADDHAIVREGLKRLLEGQEGIEIAGEATNGFEALDLVRAGGFDILLLDLSMPGKSGIELIKQVKDESPKLRVLVLTMHEEDQYAVRAIRAGASGYLTKESAPGQLVSAIRRLAEGRLYISPSVAEQSGVFVVNGDVVSFTKVTTGIIGGLQIEVSGVAEGARVVRGPFQALRQLQDGARVRVQSEPARP